MAFFLVDSREVKVNKLYCSFRHLLISVLYSIQLMHVKIFIYGVYFINAHGCKYTFLYVMFYCLVEKKKFLCTILIKLMFSVKIRFYAIMVIYRSGVS